MTLKQSRSLRKMFELLKIWVFNYTLARKGLAKRLKETAEKCSTHSNTSIDIRASETQLYFLNFSSWYKTTCFLMKILFYNSISILNFFLFLPCRRCISTNDFSASMFIQCPINLLFMVILFKYGLVDSMFHTTWSKLSREEL